MIVIKRLARAVYLTGKTWNAGHLIKEIGGVWDGKKKAWKVALGMADEAERLAASVNRIREWWQGDSAEWWIGLEESDEAKEMARRLSAARPPEEPSPDDLELARKLIAGHSWVFAKTMPKCPHYYTLRRNWYVDADFVWLVELIRRCGVPEFWGKVKHIYFCEGEWKYWSMGAPLAATILVNRARIEAPGRR